MRPTTSYIDQTLYWTIPVYSTSGTLIDADSSPFPAVAARRNGVSMGNNATVTKRSGTTGIYDCSYNTSGSANDIYSFDETLYISGAAYFNTFTVQVLSPERGSDGVSGFATSDGLNTVSSRLNTVEANISGLVSNISLSGASISAAVDLSTDALADISAIVGGSSTGLVHHIINANYKTSTR